MRGRFRDPGGASSGNVCPREAGPAHSLVPQPALRRDTIPRATQRPGGRERRRRGFPTGPPALRSLSLTQNRRSQGSPHSHSGCGWTVPGERGCPDSGRRGTPPCPQAQRRSEAQQA